jgi:hypothetical protein
MRAYNPAEIPTQPQLRYGARASERDGVLS